MLQRSIVANISVKDKEKLTKQQVDDSSDCEDNIDKHIRFKCVKCKNIVPLQSKFNDDSKETQMGKLGPRPAFCVLLLAAFAHKVVGRPISGWEIRCMLGDIVPPVNWSSTSSRRCWFTRMWSIVLWLLPSVWVWAKDRGKTEPVQYSRQCSAVQCTVMVWWLSQLTSQFV